LKHNIKETKLKVDVIKIVSSNKFPIYSGKKIRKWQKEKGEFRSKRQKGLGHLLENKIKDKKNNIGWIIMIKG
jgi:hypothetical protein